MRRVWMGMITASVVGAVLVVALGSRCTTEHTTRPLFVTQRGYIRLLDNALVLASAASMSSNSSRG